jgi:hypothetical protein
VIAVAMKKFNLKVEACDSNKKSGADPFVSINMQRRRLYIPILHIDANLINARGQITPVNQLERWFEDGVILINMPSTVQIESQAGNDHRRTRKANQQIFTATSPIQTNDPQFKKIELLLFPRGAQNENQRNDVRILCEAAKYHAILVTGDGASKRQPGGILGNREKILDIVQIMSPNQAVEFVRKKIRERDESNQRVSKELGGEPSPNIRSSPLARSCPFNSVLAIFQPPILRVRPPPTNSGRRPASIPFSTNWRYLRRGAFLAKKRFIAILEKLPMTAVAAVERHGITGEQAAHQGCQGRIRSADQKVYGWSSVPRQNRA